MKSIVLAQMEKPGLRILHFPLFHQKPDMLSLVEIVRAKTTQDHAPHAVHQRHAVAVRIEGLHGFGDADGDAGFSRNQRSNGTADEKRNQEKSGNSDLYSFAHFVDLLPLGSIRTR